MYLSVQDVMDSLGVTKMTVYKWVLQNKLSVKKIKIGKRVYLAFLKTEVDRLKPFVKKKWERGKSKLILPQK